MNYPMKAESFLRSSAPALDGKSPEPAVESTKANTENPTIVGDAVPAKAENTVKAAGSPKAENGLSNISPDLARETEQLKAENVLLQILQQSAANLQKVGIRVALSEGRKNGEPVIRFSVYGARICRECHWAVFGLSCANPKCSEHKPKTDISTEITKEPHGQDQLATRPGAL